jgi:hypothetical protein
VYVQALACKDNGVPMIVALPSSTFDWERSIYGRRRAWNPPPLTRPCVCRHGSRRDGVKEIPIEERDGETYSPPHLARVVTLTGPACAVPNQRARSQVHARASTRRGGSSRPIGRGEIAKPASVLVILITYMTLLCAGFDMSPGEPGHEFRVRRDTREVPVSSVPWLSCSLCGGHAHRYMPSHLVPLWVGGS